MAEQESGEGHGAVAKGSYQSGPGRQGGMGSRQQETQELASKMVHIQNKRFYLDVKENSRGRFVKIAEVTPGGNKNRLTLSMPIAIEFRNLLSDFVEHYAQLGPTDPDQPVEDRMQSQSLKTERIIRENKRYFLDLKENQRGRFLRVRQQQAFGGGMNQPRQPPPQIALPAQGLIEFRDTLTGLIDEYGQDTFDAPELPSSGIIGERRAKQFYMDVGQNQRGVYMRVTEQTRYFRSAITVPARYWEDMSRFFKEASEQLKRSDAEEGAAGPPEEEHSEEDQQRDGRREQGSEYEDDETQDTKE